MIEQRALESIKDFLTVFVNTVPGYLIWITNFLPPYLTTTGMIFSTMYLFYKMRNEKRKGDENNNNK
jgi:hypothetical protein